MSDVFQIKKGIRLGELDAEADAEMLKTCFFDNGQIGELLDINSTRSIILGRTGAGKSALIYKISSETEHSSILDPNDISVRFLEHSNIIQFFNKLGVKLDLFYRILWRHLLTVELLKLRYNLRNEAENTSFLGRINEWSQRNTVKRRALDYFREWGDKFWLETDEQLRELTQKFTEDVRVKLGSKFSFVDISLEGAESLSEEVRTEIKSLATQVVSGIQIQRLAEVLDLLSEHAFEDKQKRYYILIDKLDEDWAETETRCRFIRALIEETKALRRLPQVKIITSLRRDLLDLVFDRTRDSGFQEEKHEAYISKISWTKDELKKVLDKRVIEVYRRQYTSQVVRFSDVFPPSEKHGSGMPDDYIVERTMFRPRDAIQFANECFHAAVERPRISWRVIYSSEATYSHKRLKSLNEEWSEYYPCLESTIEVIRGLDTPFSRSYINNERLESLAEELHDKTQKDPCVEICKKLYAPGSGVTMGDFLTQIILTLYHVGVLGVKINSRDTFIWSNIDQPRLTKSEAKRINSIKVHKMLRHALEINDRKLLTSTGRNKP